MEVLIHMDDGLVAGTVDEIGQVAVFLVSDAACYITGTTLVVDGASAMPMSGVFWAAMKGM